MSGAPVESPAVATTPVGSRATAAAAPVESPAVATTPVGSPVTLATTPVGSPVGVATAAQQHRVVIADDDPAIRGLVEAAVRKAGAAVVASVGDGAAAVAAIRAHRPDLAILDISMPVLSGLEACHTLRGVPGFETLPIVMLSAAVPPGALRPGQDAGADLYVEKPFSPRALGATIRELLVRREGA